MRVDVHNHIIPPVYLNAIGSNGIGAAASAGRAPEWSEEKALTVMDRHGVSVAVTSISAPGFPIDDARYLQKVVRQCNDFSCELRQRHPDRFGMFASLPLPEIDEALDEIEYAYDCLDTDGICLLSNYRGVYLGADQFRPVLEELNRRRSVVFVHPTSVVGAPTLPGVSQSTIEFTFDTTRTAASLLYSGAMTEFRDIRFIFSHAGGALPYLVQRMDLLLRNAPHLQEKLPHGVMAELARHYYDTALSANPSAFASLLELVSTDHVLFGTDFPFGPHNQTEDAVRGIHALEMSTIQESRIFGGNALDLMPRLGRLSATSLHKAP